MIREIISMSIPVMIGMVSHTVLNMVDTAMVGRLGVVQLAAVGLASFFTLVMVLIFGSLNIGTQAITARRVGEERTEEFPRIAYNSILLALGAGALISIAGHNLSGWIFSVISDDADVISIGTPYLSIRFTGMFAMIVIFTLKGFVIGLGRVRIDMIVSVIINLLNIFLNYCLIFGHCLMPRLEVRGAAIASVISTLIGLVIYLLFVHFRILRNMPRVRFLRILSPELMGQIVRISAPRAVQSFSVLGFIVFLSFIGQIGVSELAISNIIFKAFNLSFMLGMAVGTASATLVGKSLGGGDSKEAVRYGWYSAGTGAVVMGIIGTLFMFFPRQIMGIFSNSRETVEKGVVPFQILGAMQFIDGVGIVLSRTLQGVGCTVYVMISETICVWAIMIPGSWIAVSLLRGGLLAAWSSLYIYVLCFASFMAWKFYEGSWKKIKI
ncbi:MAG: MATE family efflux transporter [Candidatus Krumholzibacteriota bacterium]|nr:MATE family efflux transporter [Candidatus Krumholzibacteriota bacterium]